MDLGKDMKWFCENAGVLEKFSGRWVTFNSNLGIMDASSSFQKILKSSTKASQKERPFIFHVPSKTELDTPVIEAHKK